MNEDDKTPVRCEPVCALTDPSDGTNIGVCGDCGAVWELRAVTQVDPSTGRRLSAELGWCPL